MTETRATNLTWHEGHVQRTDRERLLANGFDAYVTKPIEDEEILLGAIRRLLGSPV